MPCSRIFRVISPSEAFLPPSCATSDEPPSENQMICLIWSIVFSPFTRRRQSFTSPSFCRELPFPRGIGNVALGISQGASGSQASLNSRGVDDEMAVFALHDAFGNELLEALAR